MAATMLQVHSHTAPRVAAQDGLLAAAKLRTDSGWVWLGTLVVGAVAALVFDRFALASPGRLGFTAVAGLSAAVFAIVALTGAWLGASRGIARLFLALTALMIALGVSALEAAFLGAGLVTMATFLATEAVAQLLTWRGRESLTVPISFMLPVLLATVAVYLAPATSMSAVGGALGACTACLLTSFARFGEQAVACRHGSTQIEHAAVSRLTEFGRACVIAFMGDAESAAGGGPEGPRTERGNQAFGAYGKSMEAERATSPTAGSQI